MTPQFVSYMKAKLDLQDIAAEMAEWAFAQQCTPFGHPLRRYAAVHLAQRCEWSSTLWS